MVTMLSVLGLPVVCLTHERRPLSSQLCCSLLKLSQELCNQRL
jgi:hypothetical protein